MSYRGRSSKQYVQVSRDPFARFSIIRRNVPKSEVTLNETCAWCGNKRRSGGLFEFGVEHDDRPYRPDFDGQFFCSKSCRDTYYS